MCRGGIQDRINPYHDPITVRTDPEEPLMVKDLRDYLTNAQCICWAEQRHVEELNRLVWRCKETCAWLAIWVRKFSDPHEGYFSLTFGETLFDSYEEIATDETAIRHMLVHNQQDVPRALHGVCRVQYLLDVAAEKVAFVEELDKMMQRQRRALARLQPIIKDKVKTFIFSLGYDKRAQ